MATDETPYNLTLATKPIGYRTLFVNSRETQTLTYKYGIPLVTNLRRADQFSSTAPKPPISLKNEEIVNSDLLRYNLGKFFFGDKMQYQFVDQF